MTISTLLYAPDRVCIEFRNHTWLAERNREETFQFLATRQLPYVCVDMPQGYRNSIPPVLAATADLAVIRFHGHSARWESKDIYERFGYRYRPEELSEWGTEDPGPGRSGRHHPRGVQTTAAATTPRPMPSSSPACSSKPAPDRHRGYARHRSGQRAAACSATSSAIAMIDSCGLTCGQVGRMEASAT